MSLCQHCRTEIPEELDVCEDAKACARRVAKLLRPRLGQLVTKPYVGFDPDEAYRKAPKGPVRQGGEAA